jgi:UDP-GlcNAc:undecaprenyl-phosphate GlcNAc-1-phosphate transferase
VPYSVLLFLLAAAAAVAWVSTAWVKRLAEWVGCLDHPNERKIHIVSTPRLGGIAIILGFAVPLLLLSLHPHAAELVTKNFNYLFAVLISGSLMIVLGVYDDLFGSNAPKKFVVQGLAAAVLILFGFSFSEISLAGMNIDLGAFGPILTLLWIIGVINAVNFIDGLDALATVVALAIAAAFVAIALIRGDVFSMVIMSALAGSLIGFFPWNRPPAKIFMGDSGSLFIGLLLAVGSIAESSKSPTALIVGGPMLALALPVVDTLLVMRRRFGTGDDSLSTRIVRIFNADRSHIHHILVDKYGSDRKAVMYIFGITLAFGVAGVATVVQPIKWWGYTLGALSVALLLLARIPRVRHRKVATSAAASR